MSNDVSDLVMAEKFVFARLNKIKPGLVASYNLRPGNRTCLFSKKQIDKELNK